ASLPQNAPKYAYSCRTWVYLSHAHTATAFGMAWARLGLQHRLGNPVLVAATVISCIAVAFAGYLLFERPVMGFSRSLCRGLLRGVFRE
ncbi:MAG TPA: hypothetical protein PLU54_02640, partial [Deltaproteobacteria bacterium]|nr:hypothetical protein [Deltaproteobacteria bacterium]